ncbi:hypothetical protein BOTBODRAFT_150543 [Botryobasidium botryosum FD-172 SS1]|uniref:Beta-lactamase-related domain-containing protein n=1 Tax=Botryobasidium botryosum (strain FD-172 SS1) TaxID=930990 RepID=A0A067N3U0_BOTB1|nr:hypothetical protein BOTBODRAFT_150543 [Botryobasidium botryosum FD-172 SS1]
MSKLDALLRTYTERPRGITGIGVTVVTKDGPIYTGVSGVTSLDPEKARPIAPDTVYWLASQTKLMTAIAAMQCVERGQISLDDPIGSVLPELADPDILEGFDDNGLPKLRKAKNKITLRTLMAHTSGLTYGFGHPDLIKWNAHIGQKRDISTGHISNYIEPLVFEPGSGWAYGSGLDWVGQAIERLNACSLEEYMQKNIWAPLGMTSTTFRLESRPDLMSRKIEITNRNPEGDLVSIPQPFDSPAAHDLGGIGAYSTLEDYGKLLQALLNDGAGILKPESVDEMFKPQLDETLGDMHHLLYPEIPADIKLNFGLSVSIRMAPMEGKRDLGCVSWGGYPHLVWWIDRKRGLASTIFRQTLPREDPIITEMDDKIETAVYELAEE